MHIRSYDNCVAVIPAFNEEDSIESVVLEVSKLINVIVVDDGSSDDTGVIASSAGAFVLVNELNCGYESALSNGLELALNKGYEYAITLDADGQHNPLILLDFFEKINLKADLIIGKRDKFQRISERIFAIISKRLWGISDPLCGMKAYRLSLLKKYGPFDTFKSVGTQFAIKLVKMGYIVHTVDLMTKPRIGSARFGGLLVANYKIFRALVLTFLYVR